MTLARWGPVRAIGLSQVDFPAADARGCEARTNIRVSHHGVQKLLKGHGRAGIQREAGAADDALQVSLIGNSVRVDPTRAHVPAGRMDEIRTGSKLPPAHGLVALEGGKGE